MRCTSPISLDSLILGALLYVRMRRFPVFFYPREPTFFDRLPDWCHVLLGRPANALVSNPIALALVSVATGFYLLYVLADTLLSLQSGRRIKTILLFLILFSVVIIPVGWEMLCRAQTAPFRHAHDGGVIQSEEAVKMVLSGRNPYRETYHDTPMRGYARSDLDPPLYHWPYLPFYLVIGIPSYSVCHDLFHWFDMRILYMLFYILALLILHRMVCSGKHHHTALILFGLNPFICPFLAEGRNDIVPLTLILASVLTAARARPFWAVFLMSLACCTKQFAWLLVPFMALYLEYTSGTFPPGWRKKAILVFILPVLLIIGPFVIWDAPAFWDDVVAFNAGHTDMNYPIGGTPGYGASNFLLTWQLVASRTQYYPFWKWMLPSAGLVFILMLYRLKKYPSPEWLLVGFAVTLFTALYFSRLLHDNYLGFILALLIPAWTGIKGKENTCPGVSPIDFRDNA